MTLFWMLSGRRSAGLLALNATRASGGREDAGRRRENFDVLASSPDSPRCRRIVVTRSAATPADGEPTRPLWHTTAIINACFYPCEEPPDDTRWQ